MKYIFDADAAIDHFEDQPGAQALVVSLSQDKIALAPTTLVELYTGVYRSTDPLGAERQLREFLRITTVLPLNQRVIRRAARIRADMLAQNLSIRSRAYDILAAAFALEHNLILVTSNTRDYRGITGLTLLDSRSGQTTTH